MQEYYYHWQFILNLADTLFDTPLQNYHGFYINLRN